MRTTLAGIFLLILLSACSIGPAQDVRKDKTENEIALHQKQRPQGENDKASAEHKDDKQANAKKKNEAATGEILFCGKNDRKIALSFSKDRETAYIYFFEGGKRIELSNTHIASGMEYETRSWLLRGKDNNTALYQFGTKMMCKKKARKAKIK